jgi:NADH:ubiquinone oxidoreductase subunit D
MPGLANEAAEILTAQKAAEQGIELTAWISIDKTGKVTILNHRSEMGQGSFQAVPQMIAELDTVAAEVAVLREIYDNHAGVQDRFVGAGELTPDLAARLGVIGLAGRASGQHWDLRCDAPEPPYEQLMVKRAVRMQGDVAARVAVRFDEVGESLRLCRQLLGQLPEGAILAPIGDAAELEWVGGASSHRSDPMSETSSHRSATMASWPRPSRRRFGSSCPTSMRQVRPTDRGS